MSRSIAILGGGVAGLATATALERAAIPSRVFERAPSYAASGMAFVLTPNGLDAVARLGLTAHVRAAGAVVASVTERLATGEVIRRASIPEHVCLFRQDLIDLFLERVPAESVITGAEFSRFANGRARLTDGTTIPAPLFVAADGIHSVVRAQVFPHARLEPVRVKALTTLLHDPQLAANLGGVLRKFHGLDGGLSVGVAPVGAEHVIWYMEYDSHRWDPALSGTRSKRHFARALLERWPEPVPYLLSRTCFRNSHTWKTTDMTPLPSFFRGDVLLIGDAAHPLLALSSQGANTAIEDAVALADCLSRAPSLELTRSLSEFERRRRPSIEEHFRLGRRKLREFLRCKRRRPAPTAQPVGSAG